MISSRRHDSVAVIGGGLTGTLFALALAAAEPEWTILLVEARARAGRGIAYGACQPSHLLNVPAARMEVGLRPGFTEWLRARPGCFQDALDESGGVLSGAFVPRQLFGDYLEQHFAQAMAAGRIRRVYGEVIRIENGPRQIVLADGSRMAIDKVVLATGNLPSQLPFIATSPSRIIHDPWETGALERIGPDDSVLLLGTGLTMIDMLLLLHAKGHRGPIHAVSRHGQIPRPHRPGGHWAPFLNPKASPRQALHSIRVNVRLAEARGVPWQRVFDAARPVAASLWHGWSLGQKAQFLRHLRPLWDVHRHRMAERIAALVNDLLWDGTLTLTAGRVLDVIDGPDGLVAAIKPRGSKALTAKADVLINCTGPASDLRHTRHPLLKDLLAQGLIRSDPLGLGLESDDCAVLDAQGRRSEWLFALGPLTRPAWWEITAAPEIRAQVERLVDRFVADHPGSAAPLPPFSWISELAYEREISRDLSMIDLTAHGLSHGPFAADADGRKPAMQPPYLLGNQPQVEAVVEHGDARGRTMGFPTANMHLDHDFPLAFGIYAVRADVLRAGRVESRLDGVANYGIRPMYRIARPLLEVNLFDFDDDLYGLSLRVTFVAFLRPEASFPGLDALIAQIAQDARAARALLLRSPRLIAWPSPNPRT